jgi:CheY-like chemotaxis protein
VPNPRVLSFVVTKRRRAAGRARPCRVLLVEDDEFFVEALSELLQADGRFEIVGRASDGREGVELAGSLHPDVVLMDIGLPVMDGVEATREIRRRRRPPAVVAITGYEYEERALEVRQAGAVDYVRKGRLGPELAQTLLAAAGLAQAAADA